MKEGLFQSYLSQTQALKLDHNLLNLKYTKFQLIYAVTVRRNLYYFKDLHNLVSKVITNILIVLLKQLSVAQKKSWLLMKVINILFKKIQF